MGKEWIKKIQGILMVIAIMSVGRSTPWTVYEREIPKEVVKKAKEMSIS